MVRPVDALLPLDDLRGQEEPRIFTPPLRELTEETTLGYQAVEFSEDVCGVYLYPWQRWLLLHALELAPGLTVSNMNDRHHLAPLFRFRKMVVLVARQNGKSTLGQILSLFFMYILGTRLVLGTAQDLDTAEEVWDGALDIIEETPALDALKRSTVRVNGKKTIRLKTGERYKVKAASRRTRGLSGDLIILDELREHRDWDAWGAITKTTMARPAAQIWTFSNAGDATSVVLAYLRNKAHKDLGDPDGVNAMLNPQNLLPDEDLDGDGLDRATREAVMQDARQGGVGIFEWSAIPGLAVDDLDGLLAANPAVGYGNSIHTLLGDAEDDPEPTFRTECLCQWVDNLQQGIFPPGKWEDQADSSTRVAKDGDLVACVTVSWNRSRAHVSIAGDREDGGTHLAVVASRAGTDWLADWLTGPEAPPYRSVVLQARGAPESSLIEEFERIGIKVEKWGGPDLAAAHGSFYDAVSLGDKGTLRHRTQPLLEVAVTTAARKPMGEAWVLDLVKSAADAAPLKGAIGAFWGLHNTAPPRRSAYEDRGVISV